MKAARKSNNDRKRVPEKIKETSRKENVDHLGIIRGQNGEKGNTVKRNQIRDEGLVSH